MILGVSMYGVIKIVNMYTPWEIIIDNSTSFISIISNSIPFNPFKGGLKEEVEGGDAIVIK